MKVGLSFDLRKDYLARGFTEEETAEFDSEDTIRHLESALRQLGHEVDRIGNVYSLNRRLADGERWDLVFNVCEGLYGRSREAQVPAILESYQAHYTFGDPLCLAICLDKALAKRAVRDAGIPTAEFFTIDSERQLRGGLSKRLSFPLFVKPLAEGTGKGISPRSIVRNRAELAREAEEILKSLRQPVLVEAYLPGREFTVGVLGTGEEARALGALEVILLKSAEPFVYSYMNKELCEERVLYKLVQNKAITKKLGALALACYKVLGCRDAGRVDFRQDEHGRFQFLEMNPLAGLHPTHSDLPILCTQLGMKYTDLIRGIVTSAVERKKSAPGRRSYIQ